MNSCTIKCKTVERDSKMLWLMADIISVKTIAEVKKIIQEKVAHKDKALVFCDVDMTLVMPTEKAVRYPTIKKNALRYYWILRKNADKTKTMITLLTPPKLIEADAPKVMKNLGVRTILFTACFSGKLGPYASVKEMKSEATKKLGYDFSGTFKKDLMAPVFYKGILFSEAEGEKGRVMVQFIEKMGLQNLETIVMVDDRDGNLKDAQKAVKIAFPKMKFIGIEYGGAYNLSEPTTSEEFSKAWNNAAELAAQ